MVTMVDKMISPKGYHDLTKIRSNKKTIGHQTFQVPKMEEVFVSKISTRHSKNSMLLLMEEILHHLGCLKPL